MYPYPPQQPYPQQQYPQQPYGQQPMPPYGYPPPPKSDNTWIVVLVAVFGGGVLLIGVLAVLAIVGMRSYLSKSKSVEATNTLSEISMNAQSAYEMERIDPTTFAMTHRLCPSASTPVPISVMQVSGVKYQSAPGEWDADSASDAGFACLNFEMYEPQYFQYDYHATGTGARSGDSWIATAHGDLDGDGNTSTYSIGGRVSAPGLLLNDPTVKSTDEGE